eukprot:CAMPEP_0172423862 /NCGR_PEP_ID=MMETSP1064-20121228/17782_1 /TAXON_ID=202472 /ORGANISM="Aulacoseira subarctica , Strain CCAP 1002/5" /LENGTH=317 /DNA_ID=CAMNT_0013165413 /DNA_START=155 /DNA_END=1109 /DNA_ORIENTATION=-
MAKKAKALSNHKGSNRAISNNQENKKGRSDANNKKNRGKRGNVTTSVDDKAFRRKIESDGKRTIHDMVGDGNCMFRSLSDQVFGDYGQRYELVRDSICNYMAANKDSFSQFLVLDEDESDADANSFEQYIQDMRRDGEWGGNVELVAASRLYQRNIIVYHPDGAFSIEAPSTVDRSTKSEEEEYTLSYHDNDHYNSVHVSGRKFTAPKSLTGATQNNLSDAVNDGVEESSKSVIYDANISNGNPSHDKPVCKSAPRQSEVKQGVLRRNDTCSCGSGLKYKKCCLTHQKQQARLDKWKKTHGHAQDLSKRPVMKKKKA